MYQENTKTCTPLPSQYIKRYEFIVHRLTHNFSLFRFVILRFFILDNLTPKMAYKVFRRTRKVSCMNIL